MGRVLRTLYYLGKRPREESALVTSWLRAPGPYIQFIRFSHEVSGAIVKGCFYCTNDMFFKRDVKLLICEKLNSDPSIEASGSILPAMAMTRRPL